jgi:hypothetical protein
MQVLLDWCLTTLGWQIRGLDQVLEQIGEFKSWKKLLDQKNCLLPTMFFSCMCT